ncbi:hypothetical protein ACQQ2N_08765 [Dokdonella sp. MW10]|uniref:hypothetical protein n=1 Tax=Dokdonella sp. MW10 TaxID=2992926 RepID=UPI003F7F2EB2
MILRLVSFAACAVLLSACAASGSGHAKNRDVPATESACLARGGSWTQLGRAPVKQCLLQTGDAGKACTDREQCEGLCLAPEGTADGDRVQGTCSADTNRFGCRSLVRDGVVTTLCVD